MDLYADNILDHFRHPRHYGGLSDAGVENEEFNHACGDSLHVWLRMRPSTHSTSSGQAGSGQSRLIAEIGWTGEGCAISQASMSMLSEELENMSEEGVQKLTKDDIYALLGVPVGPRRFKCALMSLHTVKNALRKFQGLQPQSWVETVALDREG